MGRKAVTTRTDQTVFHSLLNPCWITGPVGPHRCRILLLYLSILQITLVFRHQLINCYFQGPTLGPPRGCLIKKPVTICPQLTIWHYFFSACSLNTFNWTVFCPNVTSVAAQRTKFNAFFSLLCQKNKDRKYNYIGILWEILFQKISLT